MEDLIYLDRNENRYGPAPKCFKVLHKKNFKKMCCYSKDYLHGYKSRLSKRISDDFGVDEKQIVLAYGGEDILKQVVHCYVRKGDNILIPRYSWWYYKTIAEEMQGKKVEYPIVEGDEEFYYDIDGMIETYRKAKPKIVLISSPNNPTGNALTPEQLKRVLSEMQDTIIVLDEAYTLFHNTDTSYIKELIDAHPNILIIRTFSKYYAMAGLRIGFGFMGKNLSEFSLFSAHYLGFNRLTERIALAALDSPEYYEGIRQKIVADSEMFYEEFSKLPGFKPYRTKANFILVQIPADIKVQLNTFLKNRGLSIKFMAEDDLDQHVRISIGTQEENKLLMDTIKEFLNR